MGYKISFEVRAKKELEEAYAYYNKQTPGLGAQFVHEVEKKLVVIQSNPLLHKMIDGAVRQVSVHRFPYVLIYEVIGADIIIYAVFHTKKDPHKKPKSN